MNGYGTNRDGGKGTEKDPDPEHASLLDEFPFGPEESSVEILSVEIRMTNGFDVFKLFCISAVKVEGSSSHIFVRSSE